MEHDGKSYQNFERNVKKHIRSDIENPHGKWMKYDSTYRTQSILHSVRDVIERHVFVSYDSILNLRFVLEDINLYPFPVSLSCLLYANIGYAVEESSTCSSRCICQVLFSTARKDFEKRQF